MNTWTDSLGIKHNVHEPLLKAGIPAPAEPPPGQFRALVDELAGEGLITVHRTATDTALRPNIEDSEL